jgi:ferric-dicitrate binding protein FerR (iron transport regulator)
MDTVASPNAAFPVRKDSSCLVQKEMAGELLLFDLNRKQAFCLNRSAALIWQHSDGKTSVDELARLLARETETPADTRVVEFALRSLDKDGLMEQVALPAEQDAGLDRRRLFRKLGWAAALLVALPLITTVKASAKPLPTGP